MKGKTCCFTGHRDIPEPEKEQIKLRIKQEIIKLVDKGVIYFGAGGARGFDTLAAESVLELKNIYPHIKLILVLPCANQTVGWNEYDIGKYNYIKSKADKVKVLSQNYSSGCMHRRNRHLVDNSAYCVCFCRRETGGTAYTVNYAIKQKVSVIYV